jgi:sugar lactone lactonase YvrE
MFYVLLLAISLLSGTTIADNRTLIKGSPTAGLISPVWMTLYELDGESLIVADQYAPQILHLGNVNSNNTTISALVPSNWSSGVKFYLPADVFLDIDNSYNLYVTDSGNNRIVMFHSMQTVLPPASIVVPGVAGRHSSALNYVEGPFGIKRDNQGNLIISDAYNNRVMLWAPNATSGVMIIGSGKAGNGSMELNFPSGLFLDTYNALLYVTDTYNNRIQLFNLIGSIPYNGTTVAGGNGVGTDNHQLNQPCAIWVSNKTGTMYIVDGNNHRIQRWAKGATAGVTIAGDPNGISGTDATKFNFPTGLAINADETRMYVTDTSNDRIQLFNLI